MGRARRRVGGTLDIAYNLTETGEYELTRKHYVMFANALAGVRPASDRSRYAQWLADVRAIADVFASNSSGFNRNQFMDAAGAMAPLERLK